MITPCLHALVHTHPYPDPPLTESQAKPMVTQECKERFKEGLLWAGRGTIPVNELA